MTTHGANQTASEIIHTGGGVKELGAMDGVYQPLMNLGSNNNENVIQNLYFNQSLVWPRTVNGGTRS